MKTICIIIGVYCLYFDAVMLHEPDDVQATIQHIVDSVHEGRYT